MSWRESGTYNITISLPIPLMSITKRLSKQRRLSAVVADLLWNVYGQGEIDQELAIINSLEDEASRMLEEASKKKAELKARVPKIEAKAELQAIDDYLSKYRPHQRMMNAAGKRGKVSISNPRQRMIFEECKILEKEYGSTEAFLESYDFKQRTRAEILKVLASSSSSSSSSSSNYVISSSSSSTSSSKENKKEMI